MEPKLVLKGPSAYNSVSLGKMCWPGKRIFKRITYHSGIGQPVCSRESLTIVLTMYVGCFQGGHHATITFPKQCTWIIIGPRRHCLASFKEKICNFPSGLGRTLGHYYALHTHMALLPLLGTDQPLAGVESPTEKSV